MPVLNDKGGKEEVRGYESISGIRLSVIFNILNECK